MRTRLGWCGALIVLLAARGGAHAQAQGQGQAKAEAQGQPGDPGWPRQIDKGGDKLVYYQPQIDDWNLDAKLTGRIAVEVTPKGGDPKQPIAGMLELRARTDANTDEHLVEISDIEITRAAFKDEDKARREQGEKVARALFPKGPVTVSLDRLLADVERTKQEAKSVEVKNDPPRIIVSEEPARLVVFDGDPVWSAVEKTGLEVAVNTNWPLFKQTGGSKYYLLDGKTWLETTDIKGAWTAARALPNGFKSLRNDKEWKDVKAALPLKAPPGGKVPRIYVSTTPAEIISIEGKPNLRPIAKTKLEYVANTKSDLFFHQGEKQYYFLVAGRWFRAGSLEGPWTFATPQLPADFKQIPSDSKKGDVLASVPGTPQAKEAVLQAEIPQKARVKRKEAKVAVTYAGDPQFKSIQGTDLKYAVNTSYDVIKAGDKYYVVHQGVWFSGPSPTGPWVVESNIPASIYAIPPSSPVYNATYVKVYDSTDDDVLFGFTAGYVGGMITAGVLAWGTGYYYRPWVGPGVYGYPAYFGRPYTYGAGTYYNRYRGGYYRGGAAYGPYGGVGASARYNPATGRYARGTAAYGPYGGGAAARAYNPRTGVGAASYQRSNPYGNWGRSVATGPGGRAIETGHATGARGTVQGARTSRGGEAVRYSGARGEGTVARGPGNNVYAGHDGNVYRQGRSGDWQKYSNGNWQSTQRATERQPVAGGQSGVTRDLNSAANARTQGAQRSQQYQNYRASGGGAGAGGAARTGGARTGGARMGGARGGGRRG
jgi:hypothetical protein